MSLTLEIVTPEGRVYNDAVDTVVIPTVEGEIGILPGHTPVLSLLRAGEVRVREERGGQPLAWHVDGGFLSVDSDQVTIVVDDAQPVTETH